MRNYYFTRMVKFHTKVLGNITNSLPSSKLFLGVGEVKILGPKHHTQDMMASQYSNVKLLTPYEQFLKNTAANTNSCDTNVVNAFSGCRKEVKILGKKLGTGIITSTEDGNVVEVVEERTKLVTDSIVQQNVNNIFIISLLYIILTIAKRISLIIPKR